MDRAGVLYESMCIRGFNGEFPAAADRDKVSAAQRRTDLLWLAGWTAVFVVIRFFPVTEWVGGLFVR